MKLKYVIALLLFFCFALIVFFLINELSEKKRITEKDPLVKQETNKNIHQNEAFPPIYVSILTHNEEPNSGQYPHFVNDEDAFWEQREGVIAFAEMLYEEEVSYNFQSDWTFLLAATLYDTGTTSTNEKNFLRYLKEDLGFEIDPHAHETSYNYADVAYLIEQLGVEPSPLVGGLIADPPEKSKLEYLWNPIRGQQYPLYTWQAEVLWGGGTGLHINEESLWVSGIWKPKNNENFLVHDDDAPLPLIGHYNSGWDGLHELLDLQAQGKLNSGKIYTISIFAKQKDFTNESFIEDFREQIKALEKEAATGKIEWVGLGEVYNIWLTEYGAEPNQLFYTDIHNEESNSSRESTPSFSSDGYCGDGVCQQIEKKLRVCTEDCT